MYVRARVCMYTYTHTMRSAVASAHDAAAGGGGGNSDGCAKRRQVLVT